MSTDIPVRPSAGRSSELLLDPRVHGRSRVPGPKTTGFHLGTFAAALEDRDIGYQSSRYALDADVRIVDPDNPPSAPQTVHGRPAIHAWLLHARTRDLDLHVTRLIDGGNRVAFTELWHHRDGTAVVATSTAEIEAGLIIRRHTVLVWDHDPR
ncbi:nuclear transport factor 2 family protein [uncultured Friedmanniella sp.]|uniref:nuclear transport factor 2 family protein n=1 Tax=uncultured Friedmanniella sp. TaxID=335381 RepID=UPI0035CB310A